MADFEGLRQLREQGIPSDRLLGILREEADLVPTITELENLGATADQIIDNFIIEKTGEPVEPLTAPVNGDAQALDVVPQMEEAVTVPQETIPISFQAFRRIMLNQEMPPDEVESLIAQYKAEGQLPEIEVMDFKEVLLQAKENFGPDWWNNLKESIDLKENIPVVARFLTETMAVTAEQPLETIFAPPEIRRQLMEDRQRVMNESMLSQLVTFYHETYDISSPEGREVFKRWVAEHPSQFLADAAMILSPMAGAAIKAGNLGPLVTRLNSSKVLRFSKVVAKTLIDPGEVVDIGGRVALGGIGSISDEINRDMLQLQRSEPFRSEIPQGFPEGVLTTSFPEITSEAARIKTSFVGKSRQRLRAYQQGMNNIVNNEISKFGQVQDIGVIGESVFNGFRESIKRFHTETKALFNEVEGLWERPARFDNTFATIDGILAGETGAMGRLDTDVAKLKRLREEWQADLDGGKLDIRMLDNQRTRFRNKFVQQRRSKELPVLPEKDTWNWAIYNALSDDMYDSAGRADRTLEHALRRAKQVYAEGVNRLNTPFGEMIVDLGQDARFSEIATELQKPKFMTRNVVPEVLDLVGPEAANQLRAHFLDKLLEGSRTDSGVLTPTGLSRKLGRMDRAVIEQMLGKEARDLLEDTASILVESQDLITTLGGSQTAFNLAAMDRIADQWAMVTTGAKGGAAQFLIDALGGGSVIPDVQNLAMGLFFLFGKEGYMSFIDSGLARRWRLEGFEFPGGEEMSQLANQVKNTPRAATRPFTRLPQTFEEIERLQAQEQRETEPRIMQR